MLRAAKSCPYHAKISATLIETKIKKMQKQKSRRSTQSVAGAGVENTARSSLVAASSRKRAGAGVQALNEVRTECLVHILRLVEPKCASEQCALPYIAH